MMRYGATMDPIEEVKCLVDFLGAACGENCEIVLQDLREGKMEIVAIANGHVSGRRIGSPPTDLALRLVAQEVWKTKDYICNYEGKTRNNRVLHSSTFFLKNRNKDKLLGMLCINIDTSKYTELSKAVLQLTGLAPLNESQELFENSQVENFYMNMDEIIKSVLQETGLSDISTPQLSQEDRLKIVERLMEHGIFLLRGSVSSVAERLRCSEASTYRYIAMVKKRRPAPVKKA
ncbi:MAG: PAS domain-containing protein [Treponema sp.]|jgi:predicted transcriptional regulator YheO|nr:PAS domain-containing protein [Treponema sp.]